MTDLSGLLNERDRLLRSRARSAIEDLRAELAAFGAAKEDLDTLRQAARDLDELFMLVVVGEFNSGKSALINALLGADLLEEGVTPTTTSINLLLYGQAGTRRWLSEDVLELGFDAPLLQDAAVVDTPGTNAVLRRHQEITEQFIPRSDLVLFVTSVDRPFTESERAFMEAVRGWGKKIVLVINKTDLLRGDRELRQVVEFVGENVQALLGFRPEIFPVSARRAREGIRQQATGTSGQVPGGEDRETEGQGDRREEKPPLPSGEGRGEGRLSTLDSPRLDRGLSPPPSTPGASSGDPGFARLQRFIWETLNAENRVKLKLSSPLGVALKIAGRYQSVATSRLDLLAEDARASESIEAQLGYYREDMRAQFGSRLHEVENIVYELTQRGDRFFDETFRLGRVFDLVNADKIRGDFERQVVADTAERVDRTVDSISTWMVDREIHLWQGVMEELARRRQARQGEVILGEIGGNFESSRRELIQNVTRSARQAVAGFDREAEARALGYTMREAVAQTALVEAGAVGLGTLVAVLVGTAAADVSGILAGTLLAGLGLYIIPARKRKAQKQFRARTGQLRIGLRDSLERQLRTELENSVKRIREAIAPYVRFVRGEQEKVGRFHDRLVGLEREMGALRQEIGTPSFEG